MIYTLGTVTAAGSAPFYTNPALFNTTAGSTTMSSSPTMAPSSATAPVYNTTVTFIVPHSASAHSTVPFIPPYSASAYRSANTTTVTVTVPYVVATGYTDADLAAHTKLLSRSLSEHEVLSTPAPVSDANVNSGVLKTAFVSGLAVSALIVVALLALLLLLYFRKPRLGRRSRGEPEAPANPDGFELSTSQRQYLQCGPSNRVCPAEAPKPSAPTKNNAPAVRTAARAAKPAATRPPAPTATIARRPAQKTRPANPQRSAQAVAASITLPPSPTPSPSPFKDSSVKPRRKTSKKAKTLAEELERSLSRGNLQAEDEDLDLPELQFSSVPAHPVPSPVISPPDSGVGRAVRETWGTEEPSEQAKQFYKTVRQAKKKAKELQTRPTQSV